MRGYLLDTNVILIASVQSSKLSTDILDALHAGRTYLSVISYWEVVLKSMKGALEVGDPSEWWRLAAKQLAAQILPVAADHVNELSKLPPIHQDPFDRMLIAQSAAENMTLVTTDRVIPKYASARLSVIS